MLNWWPRRKPAAPSPNAASYPEVLPDTETMLDDELIRYENGTPPAFPAAMPSSIPADTTDRQAYFRRIQEDPARRRQIEEETKPSWKRALLGTLLGGVAGGLNPEAGMAIGESIMWQPRLHRLQQYEREGASLGTLAGLETESEKQALFRRAQEAKALQDFAEAQRARAAADFEQKRTADVGRERATKTAVIGDQLYQWNEATQRYDIPLGRAARSSADRLTIEQAYTEALDRADQATDPAEKQRWQQRSEQLRRALIETRRAGASASPYQILPTLPSEPGTIPRFNKKTGGVELIPSPVTGGSAARTAAENQMWQEAVRMVLNNPMNLGLNPNSPEALQQINAAFQLLKSNPAFQESQPAPPAAGEDLTPASVLPPAMPRSTVAPRSTVPAHDSIEARMARIRARAAQARAGQQSSTVKR